jgi:trehalose 6-phosphate synthase
LSSSLLIASNRGPVELRAGADGRPIEHRGGGGLIGVLGPALAAHEGTWIAAPITREDRAAVVSPRTVELPEGSVRLRLAALDEGDYPGYYQTISTELLWFLQHHMFDLSYQPRIDAELRRAWAAYRRVNAAFASACAEEAAPGGTVLLQDYHLSLAARPLRVARPDTRIAHFTMVPWADPAYFRTLPAGLRNALLSGLLGADLLAFLVPRWESAFLSTCESAGYQVAGRTVFDHDGRAVAVRHFPVGVDQLQTTPEMLRHRDELRARFGRMRLVVRVDRMEPSKNILRGLDGFAELLARDESRHRAVVHYVLAYSSRSGIPAYQAYDRAVRERVREINDRFGTPGWQPVELETRNDYARGLAAMALADVLVVNALRDGMNLVAKEGPIVSERDLALVLSTEAGAAHDLSEAALMVDPMDITALADAIATGLDQSRAVRADRLARLRKGATALPPRRWLTEVLAELDVVCPRRAGPR